MENKDENLVKSDESASMYENTDANNDNLQQHDKDTSSDDKLDHISFDDRLLDDTSHKTTTDDDDDDDGDDGILDDDMVEKEIIDDGDAAGDNADNAIDDDDASSSDTVPTTTTTTTLVDVISVDLPRIFSTPYRPDLIHKVYVNLESHSFQPQGRHPTAGMDVVADSNDPPTGRGISRIARATGGGGRRRGEGAEVASTRGGRQAHPPTSQKVIYKQINKKEKRLALCSAVASTASEHLISSRGHYINSYMEQYGHQFPIILNDKIANYATTRDVVSLLNDLNLMQDVNRLSGRKARSGRPSLRGRSKKTGKSVLFVIHDHAAELKSAIGSLPGVDAKAVSELSVLDLAPGATAARLTIYTESAILQLNEIKSTHLKTMIIPEVSI